MQKGLTRRQFVAAVPVAIGALALTGCSNGGDEADESAEQQEPAQAEVQASSDPQPLQVTEYAFKYYQGEYVDTGYTYWVAIATNPNTDKSAMFPTFRVTATAADGTVLGTTDQVCNQIYPGQTIAFAGQMDTASQAPASLTVEMAPVDDHEWQDTTEAAPAYAIDGLSELADGLTGYPTFTGTVSNPTEETSMLAITVVMRDEAGTLVDGCSGYANDVPAGGSSAFEISMYVPANAHASSEAYVQRWM